MPKTSFWLLWSNQGKQFKVVNLNQLQLPHQACAGQMPGTQQQAQADINKYEILKVFKSFQKFLKVFKRFKKFEKVFKKFQIF